MWMVSYLGWYGRVVFVWVNVYMDVNYLISYFMVICHFGVVVVMCMVVSCVCQYEKVGFLAVPHKITAIANCKLFTNTLYTTQDGVLHHWVLALITVDYPLGESSSTHVLECSRYAWKEQYSAYVGVLDDKGNVKMWMEIFEEGNYLKAKLVVVDFKPTRQAVAVDISIGAKCVAIAYDNITANSTQSAIDVSYVSSISVPSKYVFPMRYHKMKMDTLDNLAVIVQQNGTIFFKYYIDPAMSGLQILTRELKGYDRNMKYYLDYEEADPDSPFLLSYLISTGSNLGFINLTKTKQLTSYQPLTPPNTSPQVLCDHQLSSILAEPPTTLQKQNDRIITLAQPITKFTCTTNTTEDLLWSAYYIASVDAGNQYYLDFYWVVKSYHIWWIVLGVVGGLCCCACICGCCKAALEISRKRRQENSDQYIRAKLSQDKF